MFPRLRRLQWKLTASYMFATSIVALIVLVSSWALIWMLLFQTSAIDAITHRLSIGYIDLATRNLFKDNDDDVTTWFINNTKFFDLYVYVQGPPFGLQFISLHDLDGKRLVVQPKNTDIGNIDTFLPTIAIRYFQDVAQNKDRRYDRMHYRDAEANKHYFYVPLQEQAVVIASRDITDPSPGKRVVFLSGLVLLLPLLCPVALVAMMVGLPYGFFVSRGMVRRLRRLQGAADAWSLGDFEETVRDYSQDEIGLLGRQLNDMSDQLQTLMQSRGELVRLEERNRIARDLHDSAKQQLFAIKMQLSAATALLDGDPKAAKSAIDEAEQLANQVQRELAGLIQELRPAQLEGRGLFEAVQETTEHFGRRNDLSVDINTRGQRELSLDIEQTLFRILQESLANIAKHSYATTIRVRLLANYELVTLMVEDDGHGFELANHRPGLGLRSMKERIEKQGGRFDIISTPSKGTRVLATCVLPSIE